MKNQRRSEEESKENRTQSIRKIGEGSNE